MVKIVESNFIKSATSIKDSLDDSLSEVAILGRSNVGKSSFINSLTNRKNLAKSSQTPGKTRLINFFDIVYLYQDQKFYARFVDLPGFGYAKVSKSEKKHWQKSLSKFLEKRASIRVFIHLLDSRHPKMKLDDQVREYLEYIKRDDQTVLEIFTKVDKLNQKEKSRLKKEFPDALMVSNLNKSGIDRVNQEIFNLLFNKEFLHDKL